MISTGFVPWWGLLARSQPGPYLKSLSQYTSYNALQTIQRPNTLLLQAESSSTLRDLVVSPSSLVGVQFFVPTLMQTFAQTELMGSQSPDTLSF